MKAIQYTAPRQFAVVDLPKPEPGPHQVVIRVKACGICKTDLTIHDGSFLAKFPLVNGHEFAVSNQLPNGSGSNRPTNVVLGNFSEFMIGRQGSMESEMFREGTVTDEDGNTISAVDQDCTILRIIDLHDFGIRHEESFVIGKNMQTQK